MVPGRTNLCDNRGVFGPIGDKRGTAEGNRVNGWFADYMLIRGAGATYFQVNDQPQPADVAGACHRVRTSAGARQSTGPDQLRLQRFCCRAADLSVRVMLCVLRAAGINYIIAVDGNEDRLKIAESWVPR